MPWLVSDAHVLASAECTTTRSERRRGLLGRDDLEVPLAQAAQAYPGDPEVAGMLQSLRGP